ncbi:MAG: transglutaminase domain-containing protein, partial [Planctomycetota bacterium]|nr:transglutaminase domain-containing protein [Planctomycetota bacterium]
KVYLPMGNCLIGHISEPDCMATAWMHSGGVYQMFGYTAVTWFGYMGWGIGELFGPGRLNLAESFFFNNQALLHKLTTQYPAKAGIEFETYDQRAVDYMVSRHGLVKMGANGKPEADKEPAGLLWDRDVVAFYGDPAWDARMPEQEPAWRATFEAAGPGRTAFAVTALKDGNWPSRPIMAWLPERLQDPKVVEGADLKPVVTDNFILVPMAGAFKAGASFRVVFEGQKLVRPDAKALKELEAFKARAQVVPEKDRPVVLDALLRAGKNGEGLLRALEGLDGEARGGLAFLIANMPPRDLKEISGERLADDVRLAYRARDAAPWKADIPLGVFFNDVLAYACLDEARDPWRKDLLERFSARAWACKSPAFAAVKLNAEIFKELNVQYHATKRPKPNQSPAESMKAGFASCTGLSVLLVDACRACGIPARIAGIPAWKDGKGDAQGRHGGNHSWVEIWDGRWHYIGASEPSELDKTWFTEKTRGPAVDPSNPIHRIYASSFRKTGLAYALPWAPELDWVPAVDVTSSYRTP